MIARGFAILGILLGLVGLTINLFDTIPWAMAVNEGNPTAKSLPDAILVFFLYFTHLANFGVILVYAAEASGWRILGWFQRPVPQAFMAGYIVLVMAFFHFMLAPYFSFSGLLAIANVLLHYVCPILYLAWWLAFSRHGTLTFRHIPLMLIPGLVYVGVVLGRGYLINEYPYDVLDAGKFGYPQIAVNVAALLVGVSFFLVLLIAVDGLFRPRTKLA